ncbi:MAG: LytTR family DNA-binding domain-containing protein [Bacteroidales bacterium]|nr:LytTR family DNA-binding domain-containing protein [Bacteroidales bacterium]
MGGLVLAVFMIGFTAVYRPLGSHASLGISYLETMALYSFIAGFSVILIIYLLKQFPYFSDKTEWNLKKELLAVLLTLFGLGVAIYLAAFIVEPPADRWNFPTFFDSVINAFLVGILPFAFFTAVNIPYLNSHFVELEQPSKTDNQEAKPAEERINISSQLKKESLSFFPSQFLFAESDGNYVHFHLSENGKPRKVTIRNAISNVEEQLSGYSEFFRTHRAYIVNLKKIDKKLGNASGSRLRLAETGSEVPVSRQKVKELDEIMKEKD